MYALKLILQLENELPNLLELHAALLNLNLEVDVLFECSFHLVWSELSKTFLQEMDLELYIKILLLEVVDVLKWLYMKARATKEMKENTDLFLVPKGEIVSL